MEKYTLHIRVTLSRNSTYYQFQQEFEIRNEGQLDTLHDMAYVLGDVVAQGAAQIVSSEQKALKAAAEAETPEDEA